MVWRSVSPETSSEDGDVEIGRETFGILKIGLSPETSSKKWGVEKGVSRRIMLKMSVSHETSSQNGDVQIGCETVGSSINGALA